MITQSTFLARQTRAGKSCAWRRAKAHLKDDDKLLKPPLTETPRKNPCLASRINKLLKENDKLLKPLLEATQRGTAVLGALERHELLKTKAVESFIVTCPHTTSQAQARVRLSGSNVAKKMIDVSSSERSGVQCSKLPSASSPVSGLWHSRQLCPISVGRNSAHI